MPVPHVVLSYSIQDAKGAVSTVGINFPNAVDIGQVASFALDTGLMIDGLIKGKIISAQVALVIDMSQQAGLKTAPDADSDVEEGARFSWLTAAQSITGFRLPTFDEAFLIPGTREVDLADATVDTFHDRIIAGKTTGIVNASPSDERGEDITILNAAQESFVSSR